MNAISAETRTVTIAGQERTLLLSMAAFRLAQMKGVAITLEELSSVDLGMVPRLVWVARLPFEPDLTEEACVLELANDPDCEEECTVVVLESLQRVTALLKRLGERNGKAEGDEGKAAGP